MVLKTAPRTPKKSANRRPEPANAERAGRESESRYRALFAVMSQGVIFYDRALNRVAMNPAAKKMLGFSPENSRGRSARRNPVRAFTPDGRELKPGEWPVALAWRTGKPIRNRILQIATPDGIGRRWLKCDVLPLKAAGEKRPALLQSIFTDVTDQYRAAEEIRHKASFPTLNPMPVLELDPSGRVLFCNRAAERIARSAGEKVTIFVPADLGLLLQKMARSNESHSHRDILVGDRIFSLHIFVIREFSTVRIYASDETESRRAEAELRASEARFRSVLDQSRDVIYRLNLQTSRYVYMSPASRTELGFEPEELMAMGNAEVLGRVHPEDQPALRQALARLEKTGREQVDYRFRGKDGHYAWWSNYLVVTRDESGRPLYRDGFVRNVSVQKCAEAALRSSEERYRSLFNSMTEGFAVHEIICDERGEPCDYGFLDINPAFERLTGLKRSEIIHRTHNEVLPNDSPRWVQEYGRVALTGQPVHFDNYSPELKRHYEVFAYCPASRQFAVLFMDVTERKQAEELRNRLVTSLQEAVIETESQRGELEGIFQAHSDVVLIYGLDLTVQRANPAFPASYGFDPTGLAIMDVIRRVDGRRLNGTPVELGDQITPRALRGETTAALAFLARRPDGEDRAVEISSRPMRQGSLVIGAVTVWHDITERLRAEEALRHSEERFRRLVEQSPDAMFVNRSQRVVYVNAAALALFGASSPDQILGQSPFSLFHPTYHGLMQERISRLEEGQTVPLVETSAVRLDGTLRDVEVNASAFTDREGLAIQVILHDVTDRKKKENELRRLNRILTAMTDSSQAMMHSRDEAAYLEEVCRIVVNDCGHLMAWVGYAEPDADKSVRPAAHAGLDDGYLAAVNVTWADTERGRGPTGTAIRTGTACVCKNMRSDANFSPWRAEAVKRGYASSIALPLAAGGETFGALTIYSKDPDPFTDHEVRLLTELAADFSYGITAIRLRAAQAQAEVQLRQKEEEFRTLAENSPDGIARLGLDGKHLYLNPVGRRFMGVDLLGKTWREAGVPEDFLALWEPIFTKVIGNGIAQTIEHEYLAPGEERTRFFSSRLVPETGEDGRVRSVLIIRRDITEIQELTNDLATLVGQRTKELMKAHAEVERARRMADIGRLASTIAHEMRNPLAAIQVAAYNIKAKAANPLLDKHVATIHFKVDESNKIIENLLGFSRIKSATFEPAKMVGLLKECMATVAGKYPAKAAELREEFADVDDTVDADPAQLRMVFYNILDNAYQAVDEKAGAIRVSAAPNDRDEWVITVSDNGSGIDPEALNSIFDPFFTTKSKGTGLGLAVCREVLELHRGKITAASRKGEGATFTVTLPRHQPAGQPPAHPGA